MGVVRTTAGTTTTTTTTSTTGRWTGRTRLGTGTRCPEQDPLLSGTRVLVVTVVVVMVAEQPSNIARLPITTKGRSVSCNHTRTSCIIKVPENANTGWCGIFRVACGLIRLLHGRNVHKKRSCGVSSGFGSLARSYPVVWVNLFRTTRYKISTVVRMHQNSEDLKFKLELFIQRGNGCMSRLIFKLFSPIKSKTLPACDII